MSVLPRLISGLRHLAADHDFHTVAADLNGYSLAETF